MTDLLFQTDSTLRSFEATVREVDTAAGAVTLDRTAFYAGGGGQPADVGMLEHAGRTWAVTKVKRKGADVWHWLTEEPPAPGTIVQGRLDWHRRYSLMRTHTALHVLCGVVWRDYGAQVTGGNMEPLKGRMDFEFESLQSELVSEIEANVNAEIEASREVRVAILPRDEAMRIPDLIRTKIDLLPAGIEKVRTVEIVGLDLQADGGTHVRNTQDIGAVRVVDYKSKGRINKRIYLELAPDLPSPEDGGRAHEGDHDEAP